MKITRINDKHIMDEIMYLRENNTSNLLSTGFETLDQFYKIRPTNTTIIYGYPASGKSEFALQMLVGLSAKGKKHLIYTPETGNAAEIFCEIAHSLTGKTFDKRFSNYISEAEIYRVQNHILEHFTIIGLMFQNLYLIDLMCCFHVSTLFHPLCVCRLCVLFS